MCPFIPCLLALLLASPRPAHAQSPGPSAPSQTFFPASIPLAIRSPYMSIWYNATAGADPLSQSWPLFWGRSAIMDLQGAIRVDNQTYIWTGKDNPPTRASNASITGVLVTPTRSIFAMRAGPMNVTISYLSPIVPTDWVLQSLPFSYVFVEATSLDGRPHDIQLYSELTGEWLSDDWSRSIQWDHDVTNGGIVHHIQLETPQRFTEVNQQARDGEAYFAMGARPGITWQIAADSSCRSQFHTYGNLTSVSSEAFRPISMDTPVFAVAVDLGQVQSTPSPVTWAMGYVRNPSIAYTAADGTTHNLSPYFVTRYGDAGIMEAINDFTAAFPEALERAIAMDNVIIGNASKISTEYADLVSLAARQVLGSLDITIATGTDGKPNATDVKIFMKEIGAATSYGRVNPVEQIFAALPTLLYLNASLVGPLLVPLLDAQGNESGEPYAAQDIGPAYPNATGTRGVHQQGIEQSGNMLIMLSLAKRWTDYLVQNTLSFSDQLSADTEIPNSPNMTNLAVKGIIGIKAMAEMSRALGEDVNAKRYNVRSQRQRKGRMTQLILAQDQAAALGASWHSLALSSDGDHLLGVYGDQESWSLMYNLYYDRLLGTNIVNQMVLENQTAYYKTLLETSAGEFGLPIANNVGGITNAAWLLFTAATVTDKGVRDGLIHGVWTRASFNETPGPFPGVYDSVSGAIRAGQNANGGPTFGAVFSLLALNVPDRPIVASVGQAQPGAPEAGNPPQGGRTETAAIVGSVVGGVLLVVVVLAITFFLLRRRRHAVSQGAQEKRFDAADSSHIRPLSPPQHALRFTVNDTPHRRRGERTSSAHSTGSLQVVTSDASIFSPTSISRHESLPPSKFGRHLQDLSLRSAPPQTRGPLPDARVTTATQAPIAGAISRSSVHGAMTSTPGRGANLRVEVEQLRLVMQDMRGVLDLPPDYTSNA
ncbi:hypothetical protein OH77DRAFT_1421109 [Trametes cingulata]|nr:hypothetical protein OH77DRAFT_1421109 [Trametes cingulata]